MEVVNDEQLEAWREEQRRVADGIVIPQKCSFTTEHLCRDGDEYTKRYKHIQINPRLFAENKRLLIGGVDVAFPKDSTDQAIAVYAILSYSNLVTPPSVIYRSHQTFIPPPYISSYLSFRESTPLLFLIEQQLIEYPEYRPDAIMVDGNGMWHERRAGLACFIGQCGIPSIGIGKTWYMLNGKDVNVKKAVENSVQDWHRMICERMYGSRSLVGDKCVIFDSAPFVSAESKENEATATTMEDVLIHLSSESYGLAVPMTDEQSLNKEVLAYALLGCGHLTKSKRGSKNPVYISIGSNITLQDAVALVSCTCGVSRIPEPVREADMYGRSLLRNANK